MIWLVALDKVACLREKFRADAQWVEVVRERDRMGLQMRDYNTLADHYQRRWLHPELQQRVTKSAFHNPSSGGR